MLSEDRIQEFEHRYGYDRVHSFNDTGTLDILLLLADRRARITQVAQLAGDRRALEIELGVTEAQVEELSRWGQQVTAALDGRPLPDLPDETPARIAALRAEVERLREALAAATPDDPTIRDGEGHRMGFGWAGDSEAGGTYGANCGCGWHDGGYIEQAYSDRAAMRHLHVGDCLGCGHHRALAIWKDAHPEVGVCFGCRAVGADRMRGPCDPGRCYCALARTALYDEKEPE